MRRVLVTGGAGFIGSHAVKLLLDDGADVTTLDNLSSGHRAAVLGGRFIEGDLEDRPLLAALFAEHRFDAVMHFASSIQVGESVAAPAKYYANNLRTTINLLEAMVGVGTNRLVFSSSAAIFGEPSYLPIDESHQKNAINPYGFSKWVVERILADYDRAYGLRSVSLRYFNAAGADLGQAVFPAGAIHFGRSAHQHQRGDPIRRGERQFHRDHAAKRDSAYGGAV